MNITLLQPFTGDREPPLSLAFLAGPLKEAGHRVRIMDLQIPDVRTAWKSRFPAELPDLVGITAMTPQVKQAHEIAQWIRKTSPAIPIIAGGVHPTLLPEQTLREFPAFDLVAVGEGEETIVELASRLERREPMAHASVRGIAYRSPGGACITAPRPRMLNLDELTDPHEHYDFYYYLANKSFSFTEKCVSMIVSRGCPYNCRFCATKGLWTRKYVCKSIPAVMREIRSVLDRGAEGIVFRDSTFNVDRVWVRALCDAILKEKLRFKWAVNARVNLVEHDLFHTMKKAGLDTVYFGVESGSQKILDFYGKGITLAQTEKAFAICRKLKIRTGAYFMLGALPETRADMELTYQFVKKLKPTFSLVFLFMPLPGSELYQYYIDRGYRFEYNDMRCDKAVFSSAGMTIEQLEATRNRWYDEFNRPPTLFAQGIHAMMGIRSWRDVRSAWGKVEKHIPLLSRP